MSVKIYHNPRCKKSRAGLEFLRQKKVDIEIIDYIKEGISSEEVLTIMNIMSAKGVEIIRTQEEYYRKELKAKNFSNKEWSEIISKNPKLLQRPIVIMNNKAVLGDPAENIDNLFNL